MNAFSRIFPPCAYNEERNYEFFFSNRRSRFFPRIFCFGKLKAQKVKFVSKRSSVVEHHLLFTLIIFMSRSTWKGLGWWTRPHRIFNHSTTKKKLVKNFWMEDRSLVFFQNFRNREALRKPKYIRPRMLRFCLSCVLVSQISEFAALTSWRN